MKTIFPIQCAGCGKVHRLSVDTAPTTPEEIADAAVLLAGWGFSKDDERLILICSFPCGERVMTKSGLIRKRPLTGTEDPS